MESYALESTPKGYPHLAAFSSSEANFSLFRGFSYLHSRILLNRQDELRCLEDELDRLDFEEDTTSRVANAFERIRQRPRTSIRDLASHTERQLHSSPHSFEGHRMEIFEIPSLVHSVGKAHSSNALGDYCAKHNFMKAEYVAKLGIPIDYTGSIEVPIGSGQKVKTSGMVRTTFQFRDEHKLYDLVFHILPKCVHDVILGKSFLKATRTLSSVTSFARRVKKRITEGLNRHRLFFLGDAAPRFSGLVNGQPGEALADSGSSVLVMDEDYAQTLGLTIQRGKEHHTRLIFIDGSTAYTSGTTYGVKWQFGLGGDTEEHYLDFQVLKNAPARVILSDSFLFGTEAYSRYDCYLLDNEDEEDMDEEGYFLMIGHDPSYHPQRAVNMSSLTNMEYEEQCRRNREEDNIDRITGQQDRVTAWAQELQRRKKWDEDMEALKITAMASYQRPPTSPNPPQQTAPNPPSNGQPTRPSPTALNAPNISNTIKPSPASSTRRSWLRFRLKH